MMQNQWPVWRPVLAGVATLSEIENDWTLVDLLRCEMAMDIQAEAERLARAK